MYIYTINKYYKDKDRFYDFMEQTLKHSEKFGDLEMMKMIYNAFFVFRDFKLKELQQLSIMNNNFINFIK